MLPVPLSYRGEIVAHLERDPASHWWVLTPAPGSPLAHVERRWRSPEAARAAVQRACEDAEARKAQA